MADHHDEDFSPSQTAGYKVGEKKTMEEYQQLDAQDESLNKWKESLGLKDGGKNNKVFFLNLLLFRLDLKNRTFY